MILIKVSQEIAAGKTRSIPGTLITNVLQITAEGKCAKAKWQRAVKKAVSYQLSAG